mmetsp:Transcript_31135/g.44745  ORF Transcript_31135/g.44745 Transcript_31135/m.44745 type:complete len:255 (+) Transcript_31135:1136-1900(+)
MVRCRANWSCCRCMFSKTPAMTGPWSPKAAIASKDSSDPWPSLLPVLAKICLHTCRMSRCASLRPFRIISPSTAPMSTGRLMRPFSAGGRSSMARSAANCRLLMEARMSPPAAAHSSFSSAAPPGDSFSAAQMALSRWVRRSSEGGEKANISARGRSSLRAGANWSLQMQISGLVRGKTPLASRPLSGALMMADSTSTAVLPPSTMPSTSSSTMQLGLCASPGPARVCARQAACSASLRACGDRSSEAFTSSTR